MKRTIFMALLCTLCVSSGLGQKRPVSALGDGPTSQVSVNYLYQGSRTVPDNNTFGMSGGRADLMIPVNQHFGVVGEIAGVHSGNVAQSGLAITTLTYMAGPRLFLPTGFGRQSNTFALFAQALLGGVHAMDGAFPNATGISSTANAMAMSAGGGLQMRVSRKLSWRAIQVDYLYTQLPNQYDNRQSSYRVGTGIVLNIH